MSLNTFGHLFRVTTWGESHGPAIGCTVDGCPPGVALSEADIQPWLDRRKPGQNKFTTQRKEPDEVRILSGVFEGRTTGTPIQLMIENTDQRSKDYGEIAQSFRPGHADITYHQKYGIRDYRGGGRSSARETASRVAAGGVARAALAALVPGLKITGYMVQMGVKEIDRARFDAIKNGHCMACVQRGIDMRGQGLVEVHHLLSGGRRIGHQATVGACCWHHRGAVLWGHSHQEMRDHYGPSLAEGSKPFHAEFGTNAELLARQNEHLKGEL